MTENEKPQPESKALKKLMKFWDSRFEEFQAQYDGKIVKLSEKVKSLKEKLKKRNVRLTELEQKLNDIEEKQRLVDTESNKDCNSQFNAGQPGNFDQKDDIEVLEPLKLCQKLLVLLENTKSKCPSPPPSVCSLTSASELRKNKGPPLLLHSSDGSFQTTRSSDSEYSTLNPLSIDSENEHAQNLSDKLQASKNINLTSTNGKSSDDERSESSTFKHPRVILKKLPLKRPNSQQSSSPERRKKTKKTEGLDGSNEQHDNGSTTTLSQDEEEQDTTLKADGNKSETSSSIYLDAETEIETEIDPEAKKYRDTIDDVLANILTIPIVSTDSVLQNTIPSVPTIPSVSIPCPHCDRQYKDNKNLRKHVKVKHKDQIPPSSSSNASKNKEKTPQAAEDEDISSPLTILTRTKLKTPVKKNNGAAQKQIETSSTEGSELRNKIVPGQRHCSVCSKKFDSMQKLLLHTKIHEEKKCQVCFKVFSTGSGLRRHLKIHENKSKQTSLPSSPKVAGNNEKDESKNSSNHEKRTKTPILASAYACNFCPITFKTWKDFNDHLKTHEKDPKLLSSLTPKKAKASSSSSSSSSRSSVSANDEMLDDDQEFPCSSCNKVFTNSQKLMSHTVQKHSYKGSFKCKECHKSYDTQVILSKHVERHHRPHSEDDDDSE